MNERKGTPFNRPFEARPLSTQEASQSKTLFLGRLQNIEMGKTYNVDDLEALFGMRMNQGLKELFDEFTKWKKVETNKYQLLEKITIPLPESLPERMEKFDELYTTLVGFFSKQGLHEEFTARQLAAELQLNSRSEVSEITSLLGKLEARGIIKINRTDHYKRGGNYKYSWSGNALTE